MKIILYKPLYLTRKKKLKFNHNQCCNLINCIKSLSKFLDNTFIPSQNLRMTSVRSEHKWNCL